MSINPKFKKPLDSLTQIEKEAALKRLSDEEEELLGEMGQESDSKAIPTVQEFVKEQTKEDSDQQAKDKELLKYYTKNKKTYHRYLLLALNRFLKEEDLPKKYTLTVDSTDEGIVIFIDGTDYYGAFKVMGIPKFDLNACKVIAVQLGNTIARLEGNFTKTESGIITPTSQEVKLIDHELKKNDKSN